MEKHGGKPIIRKLKAFRLGQRDSTMMTFKSCGGNIYPLVMKSDGSSYLRNVAI